MSVNILILSDSVALPRQEPEHTNYTDTWPNLLKENGYTVFQCSIGGATLPDIRKQCFYYNPSCYKIDAVILQCGIVDCAPRFLRKYELAFFQRLPKIGPKIIQLLNKNWIRKLRGITYTSKLRFEKNIKSICNYFINNNIYFISIVPPNENYEVILNGITKNIKAYNDILFNHTNVIDINGIETFGVMPDHHHLNKEGHQFVCDKIIKQLSE